MEAMKKLLIILTVLFSHCVRSQQDQCYVDAERTGKGEACNDGAFFIALDREGFQNTANADAFTNLLLIQCIIKAEVDRNCRTKSKFIPIPAF